MEAFISDSDSSDDDNPQVGFPYSPPPYNLGAKSSAESGDETGSHVEVQSVASSYSATSQATSSSSGYSSSASSYPHYSTSNYHPQMPSLYDSGGPVSPEPPRASFSDYNSPPQYRSFADNGVDDDDNDDDDDDDGFGEPMKRFSSGTDNPAKKGKYDFESYAQKTETVYQANPKVESMMAGMGYRGKGLGKHEQGRLDPIELSKQKGRSGLGRIVKGLQAESLTWDSSLEVVSVEEKPDWLHCFMAELTEESMRDWPKEGEKILVMDSFSDFVDPDLLFKILEKKTVFDDLDPMSLNMAVKRANPFETIRHGIFQNRAAMKMANMDKVFGKMFTEPLDHKGKPLVGEKDLLYFADVCAGPGGFSEYVLYRKNWQAKGIGFTLANETNDFKLADFMAGTPESFETYYGAKGDGNVYDPENITSLTEFVMMKTDGVGVHFMMADGGFSVQGQENIQEILSKRLYLCQFLVALFIVRIGGHFVCKLFDIFSPFSVGLVYLMYRSFESICIHKPNSSRPANSERYIICKNKRSDCDGIRQYMFDLNLRLDELNNSDTDILECVPMSELKADTKFFEYIVNSNNSLGERQLLHLVKTIVFCKNTDLTEPKQADLCVRSLKYWEVENETRKLEETFLPVLVARQVLGQINPQFAKNPGIELNQAEKLKKQFPSILDWQCIPIHESENCHFYLGCGKRVYQMNRKGGWSAVDKWQLELSPGTLLYGEVTDDVQGEMKSQRRYKILHVIDAIALGKKNIASRSYSTRIELCKLFAKALHKSRTKDGRDPIPIRVNKPIDMKHFMDIFKGIEIRCGKKPNEILYHVTDDSEARECFSENYFCPIKGVIFYKVLREPWLLCLRRGNKYDYFNTKTGKIYSTAPECLNASAVDCFTTRRVWNWEAGVGVRHEEPMDNVLHYTQLKRYIDNYFMQCR
ncbi:cap-specific mRNA (nucleoside-2'-O-)-methyltransferase 1 isoform X1 [Nilaparvata lugens]|uniref:cap-specific mRNA (nucleoside-2'-O-)-methyltransferase 1 isoform X1 n=1 Tax=Nilaparvata lugens TaxID=108931 RepID=UPI00193D3418|nr:cap-specific mRNA (nucleoside-2'-O-)-methyltransferase 1 isoform X1 [Nilaparvata lugens]